MKYITLTRGNSEIWYPMYELKSEYITNGYNSPFVLTTNAGIHGRVLAGRVGSGGTLNVPIADTFNDTIPKKATDFGSIMQTDCLYEQDPDLPTTPFSHLMRVDGDYYKVPIGEKPDDWDTNYFDYCTKDWLNTYYIWQYPVRVGSSSIDDIPSWDAETQYYKNNTNDLRKRFTHFFKTGAGYTFGMWTGNGTGDYGVRRHYSRCATDPGQTIGADSANKFWWRDPDGNGVTITGWTNSSQVNFFGALNVMDLNPLTPTGETSYSNSLEEDRRDFFTFIYTEYEETPFYGLMAFGINSQGTITDARGIIFEKELWGEDSITDEEPETEKEFGPTSTSAGGQGTFSAPSDLIGDAFGTDLKSQVQNLNNSNRYVINTTNGIKIYAFKDIGSEVHSASLNAILAECFQGGTNKFLTRFEQSLYNPFSAVLSFGLLPTNFIDTSSGLKRNVTAAGYDISEESTLAVDAKAIPLASQFSFVTIVENYQMERFFDGYADFNPFTKMILHLPYVGDIEIDVNHVAHGLLSIHYVVDCFNGNVVAVVWCKNHWTANGEDTSANKYIATGNCLASLPLMVQTQSGADITKILGAGAMAVAGLGGIGGFGDAIALGGATMAVSQGVNELTGKRETSVIGQMCGNSARLMPDTVWFEIIRPRWINPENFTDKQGIPSGISTTIKDKNIKSFLSVSEVDLTNIIAATQEELAEIESMLKSGILINEE